MHANMKVSDWILKIKEGVDYEIHPNDEEREDEILYSKKLDKVEPVEFMDYEVVDIEIYHFVILYIDY